MNHLPAALKGDETIELDLAALDLASIEDPHLDRASALLTLDDWAAQIDRRVPLHAGGAHWLSAVKTLLFDELGIAGDTQDYFHPRNSCLHHAITQRRGLPITLSVLYLEIARRCLRPVFGIGLPAHFVAQYNDGLVSVYIDVFRKGALMTRQDCVEMIEKMTRRPVEREDILFTPARKRDILSRMLNNLRGAYSQRGEIDKLMQVLELMLLAELAPNVRAQVAGQLHALKANQA